MNLFLHKDIHSEGQISIPEEILSKAKNLPFKNLLYLAEVSQAQTKTAKNTEDYVLIYCVTGSGHCETQQGNFQLQINQFMLLAPKESYNYSADSNHQSEIHCLHFNGKMINELDETLDFKKFAKPVDFTLDSQLTDSWKEILLSLSKGFTDENIAYANLCLYRLISFFLFPGQDQKSNQELEKEKGKEDQLDQSINFMKANVHKRLCVDEIAETFRYSPSHYSVLFKQKTGLSPIEYFIRIKIQRATELLTNSNLIVKEIAWELGYEDPFYFTRIFKKVTGKTPREFKGATLRRNSLAYQISSGVHLMTDYRHSLAAS